MRIVDVSGGPDDIARVYVVEADGALVECAEAVQPPIPRERKWVLIVSTLAGCPVRCPLCDAGGRYRGPLSARRILDQVDLLVRERFLPGAPLPAVVKVQLARMGDPAFNDGVLDALRDLPDHLPGTRVVASLSTIAPAGRDAFFERLAGLKDALYADGRFQMQFSLHTTDEAARRLLVPARTWSFERMAAWGRTFRRAGDRKVTLNFAPARGFPLEPQRLLEHFDPAAFLVKLTPINPTAASRSAGLAGAIDPGDPAACGAIVDAFERAGYETILSIGELDENRIGSNCGMRVAALEADQRAGLPTGRTASTDSPAGRPRNDAPPAGSNPPT